MSKWELASRKTIRAFRGGEHVLIVAVGDNPTPGYTMALRMSPLDIFPPEYMLMRRLGPGIHPQHVTPYLFSDVIRFPEDRDEVTVQHAEGSDRVPIEPAGPELAGFVRAVAPPAPQGVAADAAPPPETTGMSPSMSFDEAFADALANLPGSMPTHPDSLTTVTVVDSGALLGGFAGFHHFFVRVRAGHD